MIKLAGLWENKDKQGNQYFSGYLGDARDEGGDVFLSSDSPTAKAGKTRFIVKGDEFECLYHERNTIVLELPNSLKETVPGMDVYDAPSDYLYYRGIRVASLRNRSMFTYNITEKTELTEDRTVKYHGDFASKIHRKSASLKNKDWINRILLADKSTWESDFSFYGLKYCEKDVSEEFNSVVGGYFRKNSDKCNKTAISYFAEISRKNCQKYFEYVDLDKVEKAQLERAKVICNSLFSDFDDYEIKIVKTLGQETMAMALDSESSMVISRRCFEMGTKFLVSTMIEEYMHLKTGYDDMTRELQTHLFDTICTITEKHVICEAI